jgi:hypothetical protein
MTLNDNQVATIANALRVAAAQYATDAHTSADNKRLFDCFLAQSKEANAFADMFEQADSVVVYL